MLPVTIMPLAALLKGIGYWIDPIGWGVNNPFAAFLILSGGVVIDYLPILFAIAIAIGMTDKKNASLALSSNIGTRQLKEFGKGIGFAAQVRTDDKEYSRNVITKALNKSFAPEFINRLDEIITFDQLDMDALTRIIDIELKGLYSRVENIGYKLVIDEDAKKFVATKGYDVQFGARPLKRAIQNNLEDGISELILGSEMAAGDTIKVSYDKEKDLIVMTVEK